MTSAAAPPVKDVQPLDATDRAIVGALAANARITNSALADEVGIAASTCHNRVRSLVDRGVLRGFHADVDPSAMGYGLRAVIAIRLQPTARAGIGSFARRIAQLPGVQHLYFLGGADDFLIDVVAHDTEELRRFVVAHLSENPDVAATETNLVFEFVRGPGPA
jgi:DNA-binding Lrp family transcriptional regulator